MPCQHQNSDLVLVFFFNDTAPTEIYTLSLHDALPISPGCGAWSVAATNYLGRQRARRDRKSTRLNSSHVEISYAVFCLKKKRNFFDLVIGKILTNRLSLSKHLAHHLGNLLLLGKIGVFHNRRNASSRLLLLISKHLILCIYLVFRILA